MKEKKDYAKPILNIHGDVKTITKGDIGSLEPDTDHMSISGE